MDYADLDKRIAEHRSSADTIRRQLKDIADEIVKASTPVVEALVSEVGKSTATAHAEKFLALSKDERDRMRDEVAAIRANTAAALSTSIEQHHWWPHLRDSFNEWETTKPEEALGDYKSRQTGSPTVPHALMSSIQNHLGKVGEVFGRRDVVSITDAGKFRLPSGARGWEYEGEITPSQPMMAAIAKYRDKHRSMLQVWGALLAAQKARREAEARDAWGD